jgi:hypothetical protein
MLPQILSGHRNSTSQGKNKIGESLLNDAVEIGERDRLGRFLSASHRQLEFGHLERQFLLERF